MASAVGLPSATAPLTARIRHGRHLHHPGSGEERRPRTLRQSSEAIQSFSEAEALQEVGWVHEHELASVDSCLLVIFSQCSVSVHEEILMLVVLRGDSDLDDRDAKCAPRSSQKASSQTKLVVSSCFFRLVHMLNSHRVLKKKLRIALCFLFTLFVLSSQQGRNSNPQQKCETKKEIQQPRSETLSSLKKEART